MGGEYHVIYTESFRRLYRKLSENDKEYIREMSRFLADNPSGQTLRYSWFREKRNKGKRLYYLVDDELKRVIFIAYGNKKAQKDTISYVIANKEFFLRQLKLL